MKTHSIPKYAQREIRLKNSKLFKKIKIYVSSKTEMNKKVLEEVIEYCGGVLWSDFITLAETSKVDYIIGEHRSTKHKKVSQDWIVKSVSNGELENYKNYLL